jgi:hypothetical protein
MSGTNVTFNSIKGTSTLIRPKFSPGMLLQHEDLDRMTAYTHELSRLMFRSLFGCGVICGLVVKTEPPKCGKIYLTVGAGVALECSGDPVYVPKEQRFVLDEQCNPEIDKLWVILCGIVKYCAPRTSMCASDEEEAPSVFTQERDWFEIRVLSERPECICRCPEPKTEPNGESDKEMHEMHRKSGETVDRYDCVDCANPCHDHHYAGKCGCHCNDCCDCKCILLARLDKTGDDENPTWTVDHSVRRFIRPVLMRDMAAQPSQGGSEEPKSITQSLRMVVSGMEKYAKEMETAVEKEDAERVIRDEAQKILSETVQRIRNLGEPDLKLHDKGEPADIPPGGPKQKVVKPKTKKPSKNEPSSDPNVDV